MATAFTIAQVASGCPQPEHHKIGKGNKLCLRTQVVNFDAIATATGVALAHSDTYQVMEMRAGDLLLSAGIITITSATGAADLDFGFVSGDVDALVNDYQANAASSAGNYGTKGAGAAPIYFAAADTLDLDEESAAATLAGCVVKVWALVAQI